MKICIISKIFMINRSLPDLMMGVETSIPPFAMDAAAPKGAPGGLNYRISWKPYLPCRAPRGALRRGVLIFAHINCKHFTDFHGFEVNRMGSCPFLQSKKRTIHHYGYYLCSFLKREKKSGWFIQNSGKGTLVKRT